ncbi:hypothetical protein MAUB1S_02223 [Mycolicibacterium aubagnense]
MTHVTRMDRCDARESLQYSNFDRPAIDLEHTDGARTGP